MKGRMMKQGDLLPEVTFQTRVRDESVGGPNPYRWQPVTTADYFKGKRVVLFSLPGAFTPTCSTYQLPGFEKAAGEMAELGIDAIYCMSVNDSFVMNQWAKAQNLSNVKVIPDGSGAFTEKVGMLVRKDNLASAPAAGAMPPSSTMAASSLVRGTRPLRRLPRGSLWRQLAGIGPGLAARQPHQGRGLIASASRKRERAPPGRPFSWP